MKRHTSTITRTDLADAVQEEFKVTQLDASELVETVLEEIQVALLNGEEVKIAEFGTFSVRKKKERLGRNPKTLEPAVISARTVLTFRPAERLRNLVNSKK